MAGPETIDATSSPLPWRRAALLCAATLSLMIPGGTPLSAAPIDDAASTTDGITHAETLLTREIEMIRKGRLAEAERAFARKLTAQRTPRARADLMGAFAIQLFQQAPALDDATSARVLDYLERSVDGYRLVLGTDHPEVATALIRRAEVERMLHPDDPALWTDLAYQQAYRIRLQRFGGSSLATLSALIPMAELKALPSRSKNDPAEIEAAAGLLRQVIEGTALSQDSEAEALRSDALAALKRLDSVYGAGGPGAQRPQIMGNGAAQQCADTDLSDAIIFSGEAAALQTLRDRFRKARLNLKPCWSMMVFNLGPGVDPSPVLDLLTDISAGRMKGVRMGLGSDSAATPPPPPLPEPVGR